MSEVSLFLAVLSLFLNLAAVCSSGQGCHMIATLSTFIQQPFNLSFVCSLSELIEKAGEEGIPDLVHIMRSLATENIPNLPPGGGLASK